MYIRNHPEADSDMMFEPYSHLSKEFFKIPYSIYSRKTKYTHTIIISLICELTFKHVAVHTQQSNSLGLIAILAWQKRHAWWFCTKTVLIYVCHEQQKLFFPACTIVMITTVSIIAIVSKYLMLQT